MWNTYVNNLLFADSFDCLLFLKTKRSLFELQRKKSTGMTSSFLKFLRFKLIGCRFLLKCYSYHVSEESGSLPVMVSQSIAFELFYLKLQVLEKDGPRDLKGLEDPKILMIMTYSAAPVPGRLWMRSSKFDPVIWAWFLARKG